MQQNVIGLYSGRNHCVSVIGVIVIMGEEGGGGGITGEIHLQAWRHGMRIMDDCIASKASGETGLGQG